MEEMQEREVQPGIYITDFRKKQIEVSTSASNLEVLATEIQQIENSIRHLIRSNIELAEFIKEDPDPEFVSAIEENKGVIKRKQQHLKKLKDLMQQALESAGMETKQAEEAVKKMGNAKVMEDESLEMKESEKEKEGMYL